MKRFALAAFAAAFFLAAGSARAFASNGDRVTLAATFSCSSSGSQTVTWHIRNHARFATASISVWHTTPDSSTLASRHAPGNGSTTAQGNVTSGTTSEHAHVKAVWPTGVAFEANANVRVPACTVPTTVPTTGGGSSSSSPPTSGGVTNQSTPDSGGDTTTTVATLPFTGSSTGGLLALGVGAAGIGGLLLGVARRRAPRGIVRR